MAEYYPLLERAVAALPDPTPEARRSIYDRARSALIGQLRSMRPPVPEPDILRESAALDEAVARVEARFTTPPRAASLAGPAARPAATMPPPPGVPPARPAPAAPPPLRQRPVFTPRPPMPPATRATPAPPPPAPPPPVSAPGGFVRVPPSPRLLGSAPKIDIARTADTPGAAPPPPLPSAATLAVPPLLPAPPPPSGELGPAEAEPARGEPLRDAVAVRPREEGVRPAAPVRTIPPPRRIRLWIGVALGAVLASGVGLAAWRLRDRPEQVLAPQRAAVAADAPGKISGRADGSRGDASTTEGANAGGATVPAPIAQGDPGAGTQAPVADGVVGSGPPPDAPAIPVQQRAAFLVDAPDEPQKVKTYIGNVVWRSESVSAGQGQPLSSAVRAEIEVPEAKLKMTMMLQKNPEPQLPASHTMELKFVLEPGNVLGGIKQINVPELRKDDEPTGVALTGVPVAITDNNFLVGLSRGPAEPQNLRLIQERNWFDVSVLLVSGKVGKITFEKGTSGQRVIDGAAKSWQ